MLICKAEEGNDFIKNKILSGEPFIATKIGSVEQEILHGKITNTISQYTRYSASNNAGITPPDDETINFFIKRYIKALSNSDIIGCWHLWTEERIIQHYSLEHNCTLSELRCLEPFYFDNPWSVALKDKKVLVIHPFEESIITQYNKRELLFDDANVLPEFKLLTIKAEQTNGGGLENSKNFIESLNIMVDKINNTEFDVSILGCGAYGLLLADHIKSLGKQAIHIGGGSQILFGIKGGRWDSHDEISKLYNDNWVRPSNNEKTLNFRAIEGGCYW